MRSWIWLSLSLLILGSLIAPLAHTAAEPTEMVRSGGFEGGETQGIGNDWWSETWGNATVHFDLTTDKVMFGRHCQHIRVESYKDGAAQIRQMGMKVTRGQQYTIVLWMRGNLAVPVSVGFRKHGPPYTFYLQQEFRVTPTWQRFTISGIASDDDADAGLFLFFSGDGDLWIDNISARPNAPAKA